MDFDYAHFQLTEGRNVEARELNPSRQAYNERLAEALGLNRTRILAFNSSPSLQFRRPVKKPPRRISQNPEKTLDAPAIGDDFYLNILDWSSANVLALALYMTVFLWDASTDSVSELVTVDEEEGPVTSVNWAPNGVHLGVGLNNGHVQIWDTEANALLQTLECCDFGVGSLAWNSHILTTGGMDGRILNNDVRMSSSSSVVATYRGHTSEVCGLKWSKCGQRLASGGTDHLVHIWDRSGSTQWLHRLRGHTSAVKALAWCPFQSSLLATGGAGKDRTIKFWNTPTGDCLNSLHTGSQVSSLLWSNKERELLCSHGSQLTLYEYPSMLKMAQLSHHPSRILSMAQSPNGCTVASAAGDETLRLWNVFGVPDETAKKPAPKAVHEPFSHVPRIR